MTVTVSNPKTIKTDNVLGGLTRIEVEMEVF